MTGSNKLREFITMMEGEFIPNKRGTLKVELDPYMLYRTLLRMPAPENYTEPNGNGMQGLLTFMDRDSYDDAKRKFDSFGIKYHEEDGKLNNLWDKEHEESDTFNVSPYPGNNATGNDSSEWKDSPPTVKGKPKLKDGPTISKSSKK